MAALRVPSWLKTLVFAALGVGLLIFAFRGVDLHAVGREMQQAKLSWFALSMAVGYAAVISRGMRWKLVLDSMGYQTTSWRATHAIGIGYLINMVFPRAGEVARATALRRSDKVPVDVLLGTIIVERLIDLIMMAILLGITVLLTYPELQKLLASTQSAPSGDEGGFPWIAVVGLLLGLASWLLRRRFFETAIGQRVQTFLRGLAHGFTSILRLHNPWAYLGHTLFIWGAYFVMVYVCFFAMPATEHISIDQGLFVMMAASLGIVVPVPGGVGAYHYLVAKALEVLSIPYVEGLAFATLVHASQAIMLMSTGVIGFLGLSRFKND
ncbi:MAG: lysylphosphatidylglycerol synthase transmembrane domain-containing protein [Schleiferiaceae bacterium]